MWVVIAYKFEWSTKAHTGKFRIKLANFQGNTQWTDLTVADAAEFGTILQMLRSEYALIWDNGTLTTMFTEEAGEDEGGGA